MGRTSPEQNRPPATPLHPRNLHTGEKRAFHAPVTKLVQGVMAVFETQCQHPHRGRRRSGRAGMGRIGLTPTAAGSNSPRNRVSVQPSLLSFQIVLTYQNPSATYSEDQPTSRSSFRKWSM